MKLPPGYVAGVGVPKATAYGGLGQRLMQKMGWSKGQGLGKDKHGIKDAIEVKKKDDTVGVGGKVASWDWDRKYWDDAYNSAIQSVAHIAESGFSSSDSSSSDSSSDSGSGGRGGRRGRRGVKRTPASATSAPGTTTVVNRDGTLASASAAELKIAAELAKDPWGRWGGRAGKMARIRAQEQEEANRARAKLGLPPLPVASAAPAGAAESDSSSDSDISSDSDSSASKGGGSDSDGSWGRGKKRERKAKAEKGKGKKGGEAAGKEEDAGKASGSKRKRRRSEDVNGSGGGPEVAVQPAKPAPKRLVVVLGSDAAVAARARMFATFKRTPAIGWWGAKMFASAGLLESMEDEAAGNAALEAGAALQAAEAAEGRVALSGAAAVAAGQRKGFNEQDQEALYKRAQDLQRVGRRGLGKGEIKVGGAKWEGTKKTFGDDEEDDDEGEGKKNVDGDKEEEAADAPAAETKVEVEEGGKGDRKKRKKDKKKDKKDRKQQQEEKEEEGEGGKKSRAPQAEAVVGRKSGASKEAAVADAGAEEAEEAAPPKPKWLKLARMVVKKSTERRVKLRHVVSELLAAAEEQHRQHREAHKQHHHHQHKKARKQKSNKGVSGTQDGGSGGPEGDGNNTADGSPWDAGAVREALEKKIRKSNSGLAIDGKFLTLVAAADG